MNLEQIADLLDASPRWKNTGDNPAPVVAGNKDGRPIQEISDKHIKLSDGLAKDIAKTLRQKSKRAIPLEHR
ncbi:MAG: hypothetical protein QNJ62_06475 [Methyloceanibacter sp.]|nr:hypothetical protein [Methyloceanibacter sp.]